MVKHNEKEMREGTESLLSTTSVELGDGNNNNNTTTTNAQHADGMMTGQISSTNGGSVVFKRAAGPCAALFLMAFIGAVVERNLMGSANILLDDPATSSSSTTNNVLSTPSLPIANNVLPSSMMNDNMIMPSNTEATEALVNPDTSSTNNMASVLSSPLPIANNVVPSLYLPSEVAETEAYDQDTTSSTITEQSMFSTSLPMANNVLSSFDHNMMPTEATQAASSVDPATDTNIAGYDILSSMNQFLSSSEKAEAETPGKSTVNFISTTEQEDVVAPNDYTSYYLRGGSEGSAEASMATSGSYQSQFDEHNTQIVASSTTTNGNNDDLLLYEAMANVNSSFDKTRDIPIYWKLLRTGNVSILPYLTDCLNMVTASEVGVTFDENVEDEAEKEAHVELELGPDNESHTSSSSSSSASLSLQVITLPSERRYVNVDTSSSSGLIHAKEMNLVESGMVDVIVSPLFQESVHTLFDETTVAHGYKARFFTMLRHPVERFVSVYQFLKSKSIKSERHAFVRDMTLMDYANSQYAESNRVVRGLVHKKSEALTGADLEYAKTLLKEKFLVGLTSELSDSLERIRLYFGYSNEEPHMRFGYAQTPAQCKEIYLKEEHTDRHRLEHPIIVEGSDEWKVIQKLNWADGALYEYVSHVLYKEQGQMFPSLSSSSSNPSNT